MNRNKRKTVEEILYEREEAFMFGPKKDEEVDWKEEMQKCKDDPYYFFITYYKIDGKSPTMTREEFDSRLLMLSRGNTKLAKTLIFNK